MPLDDPRLIALAERVADGEGLDAAASTQQEDAAFESCRSQLRILSQIYAVGRNTSAQGFGVSADPPAAAPAIVKGDNGPSDSELRVAKRFGTLVALERVGAGTFGDVYRAWDPNLRREVALKVLRPASAAPNPSLILGEGQRLAKIRHPNVLAVHGAQVIDGRVIIWSEFLHGRTLAEIVTRDGPLSAQEAVIVGDALCRALSAVHNAGLLHRDIKAQNVMRDAGGRIVLMDLGLGQEEQQRWTRQERIAGTPMYLAPELLEQAPPSRSSDVYSLGILLYYLVTGSFPVEARTLPELMTAHRAGTRRLLQEVRPDLPAAFSQTVERALDHDPARRPSVGALQQALARAIGWSDTGDSPASALTATKATSSGWRPTRIALRVAAAVLVAGLMVAAALVWVLRPATGEATGSVAVLPLRNTSGDASKDYFADALTQEVISRLSKLRSVRVIAPTSTMSYRDTPKPLPEIGRELQVGAVVTGSVSWIGDRVRVVAALIEVPGGASLWSETYDRDVEDILGVQSDLSQRVVAALGAHVTTAERTRVRNDQPVDFETYQLYLKGRYHLSRRTETEVDQAIATFQAAIARAPYYAPAYAGLANAYNLKWGLGFAPASLSAARDLGRDAAKHAIELDDGSAEAHLALAFLEWGMLDWNAADVSFQRALALNPGEANGHHWYALYLTCVGRMDEAVEHIQLAQQLDPVNVRTNSAVGWVYYQARQYARAEAQLKASLRIDSRMAAAHSTLAVIYSLQDRHAEAVAEMESAVALAGGDPEFDATLAYVLARAGRDAEARTILAELTSPDQPVMAGSIAVVYSALGEVDRAFEWLDRSMQAKDIWTAHLRVEPRLDALRRDRRFNDYLRQLAAALGKNQARGGRAAPDARDPPYWRPHDADRFSEGAGQEPRIARTIHQESRRGLR